MRELLRSIPYTRRLYYRWKRFSGHAGQSDEAQILSALAVDAPKTFVEFGFHAAQFNCASLARNSEWRGLLIDGNERQVGDALAILPKRVQAQHRFLTLNNLSFISAAFDRIGVLSIDVDGNDYWFLEKLIDTEPHVIAVEYNASFGPSASISVPYDPAFDRHQKHLSGWYHGASLMALCNICARHGYGLAAISAAGANAFFTKSGTLDPAKAWRPNSLRNDWSKTIVAEQWRQIRDLPYVEI